MQTRNKYILVIIAAWIFFIFILSVLTAYLTISGFIHLEKKVTIDNSDRVMRVLVANLERIYLPNSDYAYWDEMYQYVQNKNANFVQTNLAEDFFKTNKLNYVLILDNDGKIILSKGYDLTKNTETKIPAPIEDFFKKNSHYLINYGQDYNDLLKKQYGFGGLLPAEVTQDEAVFFVINAINNSNETSTPNGYLIYGKILNPEFFSTLNAELGYEIKLIPKNNIAQLTDGQTILNHVSKDANVYIKYVGDNSIFSYRLLNDVSHHPLALVQVEFPRILYAESVSSFIKNSLILLLFSLIGMFSMSALVYGFFKKQEIITSSFERFVPHELIELLNKKSILEVILGTNSKRNLSVFFMDIRNFTAISEKLSPQESFDFLNTILREIAPIVIKNHGFIDKYIGDAIMALFPNNETNADNAVAAAMMILDEMDRINYTGKVTIDHPVKVGIGINTGHSILGIIGTEGRLEGTVISDAVNTASRIQALTKVYDCSLLISEETFKSMKHPEFYQITHLEEVQVKGKVIKISIYKVEKRH